MLFIQSAAFSLLFLFGCTQIPSVSFFYLQKLLVFYRAENLCYQNKTDKKLLPQFRQIVCLVGALRALFIQSATFSKILEFKRHAFLRVFPIVCKKQRINYDFDVPVKPIRFCSCVLSFCVVIFKLPSLSTDRSTPHPLWQPGGDQ